MKAKSRLILIIVLAVAVLLCYFLPGILGVGDGGTQVIASAASQTAPLAPPEEISARYSVLIEADSYRVIWERDSDVKAAMASTTKIMTALIALTQDNIDEQFVVDGDAITVEGSSMGLQKGDTVTLRALAVGMLTVSGNDAANAAAVRISGSVSKFAQLMNNTARALGMNDTHFVTPSGLDADGHRSTAYDMAILAANALKNEDFTAICGSNSTTTSYGDPPYLRNLLNGNKMLRIYDGAIGVKTGYTTKAGRCLVSAAQRGGVRLICVTLNASDDWNDHTKLLDYGFSTVVRLKAYTDDMRYTVNVFGSDKTVTAIPAQAAEVSCLIDESNLIEAKINLPIYTVAPVYAGQKLGNIEYYYNGRVVATTDLIAAADLREEK